MFLALAACVVVAVLWWYGQPAAKRPDPKLLARRLGGYAALGLAGLLVLRGRLDMALIAGLGAGWLLAGEAWLPAFLRGRVPGQGRSSAVAMSRDPASGRLCGTVQVGPHAGRDLDALPLSEVAALRRACLARDPDSARLLEAYLDGRAPGWREDAELHGDPRAGGAAHPGAMTEEQAYQVLGLPRGAAAEEVRAAHRRLMKRLHPDQGGSDDLAARVNAAKDRLLGRHR